MSIILDVRPNVIAMAHQIATWRHMTEKTVHTGELTQWDIQWAHRSLWLEIQITMALRSLPKAKVIPTHIDMWRKAIPNEQVLTQFIQNITIEQKNTLDEDNVNDLFTVAYDDYALPILEAVINHCILPNPWSLWEITVNHFTLKAAYCGDYRIDEYMENHRDEENTSEIPGVVVAPLKDSCSPFEPQLAPVKRWSIWDEIVKTIQLDQIKQANVHEDSNL